MSLRARKLEVLAGLYNSMRRVYANSCLDLEIFEDKGRLSESLKKSHDLSLRWDDFYKVQEQITEDGRQELMSRLEKEGPKDKRISKDSQEFYQSLLKEFREIRKMIINEKFSRGKIIGHEDYETTAEYFKDNPVF